MGAIAGKNAEVMIKVAAVDTPFGEVKSYNFETALGTIDVSTLSTYWKKKLVGQVEWSGSLECFYDPSDPAQEQAWTDMVAGNEIDITIRPSGTGTDKPELTGKIILTGWAETVATDDAIGVSIKFQGNGELTRGKQAAA